MQENSTYNYVICGDSMWTPYMFGDLYGTNGVKLFYRNDDGFNGFFSKLLWHVNYSKKINKYIKRPFNKYIVRNTWNCQFDNNLPVCYILMGNRASVFNNKALLDYWRQSRPNCKIVLYLVDLVSRNALLNIDYIRENFDIVISYDKSDSQLYGWLYYPTPYSRLLLTQEDIAIESDLYFCGSAKNRLSDIIKVYEWAKCNGLSCKFFISGVSSQNQIYKNDIHYNQKLTYAQNLQYAIKSKCIVEIMQKNATGYTPRLWEAIMLDKHLLTNNQEVLNSPYYIPKGMHFFSGDESYDLYDLYDQIDTPIRYSEDLKQSLSPFNFIKFMNSIIGASMV